MTLLYCTLYCTLVVGTRIMLELVEQNSCKGKGGPSCAACCGAGVFIISAYIAGWGYR